MKTTVQHSVQDIFNAIKTYGRIYLNKNGDTIECIGTLHNETIIKMVPADRSEPITLLPEHEIYYNT